MRFFLHQRGAVLLEAAIAFPVLIAILYGMVEFGVAFTVKRKNIQIVGSVADLVSQQMKPTCSQLDDIAGIGATILKPYSATPSSLVVSSILICNKNASSNAAVVWSKKWGSLTSLSALPVAAKTDCSVTNYDLPQSLAAQYDKGNSVVFAEAGYEFTPAIGAYLTGKVTFDSKAYYIPRFSSVPACTP
jgi:Flp pilus assembly protein TadG